MPPSFIPCGVAGAILDGMSDKGLALNAGAVGKCDLEPIYRPIQGYFGYEVGDDGSVWTRRGRGGELLSGGGLRQMKPSKGRGGYLQLVLSCGGKKRTRRIFQLVLEAFVGPRPKGMEGCHNDGNRMNNRLTNLRWDSKSSNQQDRVKHGTTNRGEKCHSVKLSEVEVHDILRRLANGERCKDLAKEYNVANNTISQIKTRARWSWLQIKE